MILQKIKQTFSDASGKSPFFDKLYLRTKYRMAMFLGAVWSEEHYARWFYHLYTGKKLNLQNPRYFDEKLWWLKLNNRDPLLTKCSDKHAVRDYVKACGYEDIRVRKLFFNGPDVSASAGFQKVYGGSRCKVQPQFRRTYFL